MKKNGETFLEILILFADMRDLGWIWGKVVDGFVFSVGSLFHGKTRQNPRKNQFSLAIRIFSFADVELRGCQVCRFFFAQTVFC